MKKTFLNRLLLFLGILSLVLFTIYFFTLKNLPPEARFLINHLSTNENLLDMTNNPEKYHNLPCIEVNINSDKYCFDQDRVDSVEVSNSSTGSTSLHLYFFSKLLPIKEDNSTNIIRVSFWKHEGNGIFAETYTYGRIVLIRQGEKDYDIYNKHYHNLTSGAKNGQFINITNLVRYPASKTSKSFVFLKNKRMIAFLNTDSNEVYKFLGDIKYQLPEQSMYIDLSYRSNGKITEEEFMQLMLNLAKEFDDFLKDSKVSG